MKQEKKKKEKKKRCRYNGPTRQDELGTTIVGSHRGGEAAACNEPLREQKSAAMNHRLSSQGGEGGATWEDAS